MCEGASSTKCSLCKNSFYIKFVLDMYLLQHKCAMYWPSRQAKTEVHGPLRVTYLDEEAFAHYTVRRFELKPVDQSNHYCQVGL